jgi:hypothetical protein
MTRIGKSKQAHQGEHGVSVIIGVGPLFDES